MKQLILVSITLYLLALLPLFLSCSSHPSDTSILKELDDGLLQSNASITLNNANILETLKSRTFDPKTRGKAGLWFPKAQQVSQLSQIQINYLDSLKSLVKNSTVNHKQSVNKLFSENNLGEEIFVKLNNYKQQIVTIDSKIQIELSKAITIFSKDLDSSYAEQFITQLFNTATGSEATAFLSKLQNNILIAENKCLSFCLDQTGYLDGDNFIAFEAIVGQNAQILKTGNELVITAGLGGFSKTTLPKIIIAGEDVAPNERGIVIHKIKTSRKPGNYSIPVTIEFVDQEGNLQTRTFDVKYTLVEELKKN